MVFEFVETTIKAIQSDEIARQSGLQERGQCGVKPSHCNFKGVQSTSVRVRFAQFVLGVLVSSSLLGPAFERIDHWDHFLHGRGDIVLTILGFGIVCGQVVTLVRTLIVVISAFAAALGISIDLASQVLPLSFLVRPAPFSAQSPPLALRI